MGNRCPATRQPPLGAGTLQAIGEIADRRRSRSRRASRAGSAARPASIPRISTRAPGCVVLVSRKTGTARDVVAERLVPLTGTTDFAIDSAVPELGHAEVEPRPIRGGVVVPLPQARRPGGREHHRAKAEGEERHGGGRPAGIARDGQQRQTDRQRGTRRSARDRAQQGRQQRRQDEGRQEREGRRQQHDDRTGDRAGEGRCAERPARRRAASRA